MSSKTLFMLMAEFDGAPAVELNRCYHHLGYTTAERAQRAAADYELPVPWYRGRVSQKSPRMVHLDDLAKYIDSCADEARREFKQIHGRAA